MAQSCLLSKLLFMFHQANNCWLSNFTVAVSTWEFSSKELYRFFVSCPYYIDDQFYSFSFTKSILFYYFHTSYFIRISISHYYIHRHPPDMQCKNCSSNTNIVHGNSTIELLCVEYWSMFSEHSKMSIHITNLVYEHDNGKWVEHTKKPSPHPRITEKKRSRQNRSPKSGKNVPWH